MVVFYMLKSYRKLDYGGEVRRVVLVSGRLILNYRKLLLLTDCTTL